MCKSRADGGQRCATHTRPKYLEALTPAENKSELEFDEQILLGAATVPYATTLKGIKAITEDIERFDAEGKIEVAAILRIALNEGRKQREETKELEMQIYCHREAHMITAGCLQHCYESGLNLWDSYKKVNEIADQLLENIGLESQADNASPELTAYRIKIAQIISRTMKNLALDFYASAASNEEVSAALLEREVKQDTLPEFSIEPTLKDLEDLYNSDGVEGLEGFDTP